MTVTLTEVPYKELVALYYSMSEVPRIIFHYICDDESIIEEFQPSDTHNAIKVSFEVIETKIPGSVARAKNIEVKNIVTNHFQITKRYIAKDMQILFLCQKGHEFFCEEGAKFSLFGFAKHCMLTSIAWSEVPIPLRLICEAANIDYVFLEDE